MSTRLTRTRGPKPADPRGVCECGASALDYAPEWQIAPTRHMRLHDRPAPEDRDATLPGYRYGDEVWTPVCYAMTPDRYTAPAYGQHLIRLALLRGQDEAAEAIAQKFGIAPREGT